ncbi:MAG: branched-chain amino acid ABC transporter permease [Pseudomonadota bacterium]|nr:branched-chain amino acid ABC transporter permease [Pseudomonadota bacterium]MEE3100894.1 branched-chain amino acid ABC transporter permease [Pseudomonadota bacterium]
MILRIVLSVAIVAALACVPLLLPDAYVNAAIQMLIAALFATAFGYLCGQGGMLSFGHSAYFGLGAFAAIHAMNAVGGEGLLPTPLIPVFGAAAGLAFGLLAGWFATKRSGVYFSMITLAIAELVHALAPHLKETFGGEGGVSTFRMPAWGISFGASGDVYWLALAWTVLCVGLLYLLTRTPFGRMTVGLRENTHRMKFIGYEVHRPSAMVFAISGMVAGVAGALQSINIEAANYVVFETSVSSAVVLNSFIGGVRVFFGPAIGGALMSFFGYVTADMTRSWLLYQGLIFVLVMMFLPRGVVGEIVFRLQGGEEERRALRPGTLAVSAVGVLCGAAGVVLLVEIAQRLFAEAYPGAAGGWPPVTVGGVDWSPLSPVTWLLPALLIAVSVAIFLRGRWRDRAAGAAARSEEATR